MMNSNSINSKLHDDASANVTKPTKVLMLFRQIRLKKNVKWLTAGTKLLLPNDDYVFVSFCLILGLDSYYFVYLPVWPYLSDVQVVFKAHLQTLSPIHNSSTRPLLLCYSTSLIVASLPHAIVSSETKNLKIVRWIARNKKTLIGSSSETFPLRLFDERERIDESVLAWYAGPHLRIRLKPHRPPTVSFEMEWWLQTHVQCAPLLGGYRGSTTTWGYFPPFLFRPLA